MSDPNETNSHGGTTDDGPKHFCCVPACPGLPYKASDHRHPCGTLQLGAVGWLGPVEAGMDTVPSQDANVIRVNELGTHLVLELVKLTGALTVADGLDRVDAALAAAAELGVQPGALASSGGRRTTLYDAVKVGQVAVMSRAGSTASEIAATMTCTVDHVKYLRKQVGITAPAPGPPRSGWEDTLRELHAEGKTVTQIIQATGWGAGTTYNRLSALGLKATRGKQHRRIDPGK